MILLWQLNLQAAATTQPPAGQSTTRTSRRPHARTLTEAQERALAQGRADAEAKARTEGVPRIEVIRPSGLKDLRGSAGNIDGVLRELEASLQADALFGKQSAQEAALKAQLAEEDELIAILVAGDLI